MNQNFIDMIAYIAVVISVFVAVLVWMWLKEWMWRRTPRPKLEPVPEPDASIIQRLELEYINQMKKAGVYRAPPSLRQLVDAGVIQHPGEESLESNGTISSQLEDEP